MLQGLQFDISYRGEVKGPRALALTLVFQQAFHIFKMLVVVFFAILQHYDTTSHVLRIFVITAVIFFKDLEFVKYEN